VGLASPYGRCEAHWPERLYPRPHSLLDEVLGHLNYLGPRKNPAPKIHCARQAVLLIEYLIRYIGSIVTESQWLRYDGWEIFDNYYSKIASGKARALRCLLQYSSEDPTEGMGVQFLKQLDRVKSPVPLRLLY